MLSTNFLKCLNRSQVFFYRWRKHLILDFEVARMLFCTTFIICIFRDSSLIVSITFFGYLRELISSSEFIVLNNILQLCISSISWPLCAERFWFIWLVFIAAAKEYISDLQMYDLRYCIKFLTFFGIMDWFREIHYSNVYVYLRKENDLMSLSFQNDCVYYFGIERGLCHVKRFSRGDL